ncbi:MAG: ABC transporter permease subunit [Actinobacteria bacterium]|nr:ABC transporter permease subunit [Actinomycetota bacterium]
MRLSPRLVRGVTAILVITYVVPFLALPVRVFANQWRFPAIAPQEWGLRGWNYALSPGVGAVQALQNSLLVALAVTAVGLVVGWPAARALGEGRVRRPIATVTLVALPLLVPQYAVGTGLAAWFIRVGLADRLSGVALAHLPYVLPYVVLLLAPGFGARVKALEEAARSLGAGPLRRILVVTVPAVLPSLATAALLGFLVSWSQYGTSLAVGGGLPMLPLVLVPFVGPDPQVASALALLLMAPAVAALVVALRAAREPI